MTTRRTRERRAAATVAALFPGQGVDVASLRASTRRLRPDLVDAMDEALGRDAFATAGESTACAQPAVYCASLARWGAAARGDVRVFCGHSLGEITALAAAGLLDHHDGLGLVVERGRLMDEAARARAGSMLAVGASRDEVAVLARSHKVSIAGDNAPGQVVVSGAVEAVDRLAADARSRSIPVIRLGVAGAFHSPLMAPAVAPFAAVVRRTRLRPASGVLVMSAISASPLRSAAELAGSLTAPVRWRDALEALRAEGVTEYLDVGPGRVLSATVRRTLRDARVALVELGDEDGSPKSS